MRAEAEAKNQQRNQQQKKYARRIHFLIYCFAAKNQAGHEQKNKRVSKQIKRVQTEKLPRNQRPVVDNQVSHPESPFQMRNDVIKSINDGTAGFGHRKRNGVEVSADAQNGRDDNKTNCGVGRRRGENERTEQ